MSLRRRHLLAALPVPAWPLSALASRPDVDTRLRAVVQDPDAPLMGLSVRLQVGARAVYAAQFGWQQWQRTALHRDTRFRIASVSKLAVALVMARLHAAGKLDLDADLAPWIPGGLQHPAHPDVPITARLLLNHQTGLRDPEQPRQPSTAALRAAIANPAHWHANRPGTRFSYCNFAFGVLATAMEAACNQRFDRLMQHWLFTPLGIHPYYDPCAVSPAQRSPLATLYRQVDRQWVAQADEPGPTGAACPLRAQGEQRPGDNGTVFGPQGGLRISLPELGQIAQLLTQRGRWKGHDLIPEPLFDSLLQASWTQTPGDAADTMGGIFQSWGVGLQRFTDQRTAQGGDRLHSQGGWQAWGHLGEAYGLLSGLIFQPQRAGQPGWALMYALNGTSQSLEHAAGRHSSFSHWEERILEVLLDTLPEKLPRTLA
ncbi:serine hydrolase domain-containing protein [Inhella gelatinilytica]|uniref:Serine hydrolase n=1 Tax=Inhella gelatinilytica TaxID=2795030 RepID=A0A931NAL5_9BURK|nr:serine hydrolase [Inhella gelatinilytica]MBH9552603.1 serine hydrolase [Inhella gelatinilytica]